MDKLTQIATNQLHPVKPIKYWEVRQNGVPIFRNNSVKICQYWRTNNGFNTATLHAIR